MTSILVGDALRAKFEESIPARLRVATISAGRRQRGRTLMRQAAAILLIVGVGAAGGWFAHNVGLHVERVAPDRLAAASTHADAAFRIFSVEARHPVQVNASESSHLAHWISARL